MQHIKTISLPILDYNNYNIKLNLLSNQKILAFFEKKNKNKNFENKILYITLNDYFTIKSEKIIDNFFYYKDYFEIDKEKLFLYKDEISYILNIKTFVINKFYLNYLSFFNYINGNIIGFNSNIIDILNLSGEILLSKETEEKNYHYGLLLSNNNLFFANSKTIFLFNEKINEIKNKTLNNYDDISYIANFDKRILVKDRKIFILNLNLEIETINIYRFYINNYISFISFHEHFIFINNKKYMVFEYVIPYLFHANNNKIIFGRLRNEKNNYKRFKIFYNNKKIFILYSNHQIKYKNF